MTWDIYQGQARVLDPLERRRLVIELQKIVLESACYMPGLWPGLWWSRNVAHRAKVKNYIAPPSHFTNQKLQGCRAFGRLTSPKVTREGRRSRESAG